MARVAGVDLPPNKRAEVGLTYIYGIGRSRSFSVLKEANVNRDTRVRDLTEDELSRIRAILEAQARADGHQALDGYRLLSRFASSSCTAGAWSANTYKRSHPQGPTSCNHCEEESAGQEVT